MNRLFKITLLAAVITVVITGTFTFSINPAAATTVLTPPEGEVGSTFIVTGADQFGELSDTFWFSNGSYSTFITPLYSSSGVIGFKVPASVCPGAETVSCSSNFSTSTPGGSYTVYVNTEGSGSVVKTILGTFTVLKAITDPSPGHDAGTNVISNGTVYFLRTTSALAPDFATERVAYTSAGAFLSYKFNSWNNVVPATAEDMALPMNESFIPPRNGSLINDNGTVYLITRGTRAGFTTEAVFKGLGYSYANVYPGDTSFMPTAVPINSANQGHFDGTIVNDNGTLYLISDNGNAHLRRGFTSFAIFDGWGFWASDAVKANSFDLQATVQGYVPPRMSNQLNIPPLDPIAAPNF